MPTDEILDPAHDPNDTGTNMGAAGLTLGADGKPVGEKPAASTPTLTEDGNQLEYNGKKYVTHEALHRERTEKQNLANTLAQLDPVMPEFEEFLKVRNGRRENARDRAASPAGGGGEDDKEYLNEVALALGFYDESNQPDLRRAQAHINITRREANRAADTRIKPIAETTARDRGAVNRERARANVYADGRPIAEAKYMDAALDALSPDMLADPNVANVTQVIAAGLEYLDMRKNGTLGRGTARGGGNGQREPVFVERGTGRYDGSDDTLSDLDLAAARARGKSPEQWAKLSKQINPSSTRGGGGSNRGSAVLEDI